MTMHSLLNNQYIRIHSGCSVKKHASSRQTGVSLIEVLVAMFILSFGALAIVNLQTNSILAVYTSAGHFKVNELSQVIVEQLIADSIRAAEGQYNTDFSEEVAPSTASPDIAEKINMWKASMSQTTSYGETSIDCNASECLIALKWRENTQDGTEEQVYNLKTPI